MATPRNPVAKLAGAAGAAVARGLAAADVWLEKAGALPELKPLEVPQEVADEHGELSEECKEIRDKLRKLVLNDADVWAREEARKAKTGDVLAPWFIKAPFWALCVMLDACFANRPIQRFWVLETVARIPYFAYISILHLYESLGFWRAGAELRRVHFAEEWNELHHLQIMESLGGDQLWFDRFLAQHAALAYYWVLIAMYLFSPRLAYAFSELVELHAADTYEEFVAANAHALAGLPPPLVAAAYYRDADLYMFDELQTCSGPGAPLRRPPCNSLLDVFENIRDDEVEHVKTMHACQDTKRIAADLAGRLSGTSRPVEGCAAGDVIELLLSGPDGGRAYVEVLTGWAPAEAACEVLWKGQLLRLGGAGGDGGLQLSRLGGYPAATSATVAAFPELAGVLPSMHAHGGDVPAVTGAAVVESLGELLAQVDADAAFWRDGLAPGGPIKSELQQAVFTAGELGALLAGQRGVVLVQAFNGWDAAMGQPLYNPLAITMLERAAAAPGVGCVSSVAPGGVGLTAILYADREPFASWARHLASFGCQSNVVAGSVYYKLLIGQLLGYKLENVLGYCAASGEPATPQLQAQVAADIRKLSKVKAKLPWSAGDKARKPKTGAAGGRAAAGGGFGAKK
ncbi:AOX4 [Scenedesmus sp. PABB004]|nr:AOX4 [Scenedesmus sp. PABB004]